MRGVALCEKLLSKAPLWPPLAAGAGRPWGWPACAVDAAGDVVGARRAAFCRICHDAVDRGRHVFVLKAVASVSRLARAFAADCSSPRCLSARSAAICSRPALIWSWPGLHLNPNVYAMIGMSALSASVIGGPLTMSFIALESTGNLWLTTAVLVAVMISTQITRELVRLFVRDLAIASARRDHPQRGRRRLDPRSDGAETDAAGPRHGERQHGNRGIPQEVSAGLEDAGGRGRLPGPLRRAGAGGRRARAGYRRGQGPESTSCITATWCCIPP